MTKGTAVDRYLFEENGEERFTLLCGESKELLASLPDRLVSCIITSPPYWGLRTYGHELEIGRESTLDEYIVRLVDTFSQAKRLLRDDGVMWLVMGDAYTSGHRRYRAADKKHKVRAMLERPRTPVGLKEKDLIGLPWRVAFALQADGWYLRTDVVWAKPNPMPETVRDRPNRSHEYIFLLSKSPSYFFNKEGIGDASRNSFQRSVWTVPVGGRKTDHPAAFPLDLIVPCVGSSSRPGDLILDPFAGSGSVGIACLRAGRRFLGIEVVPEYAEVARQALASCAKQYTDPYSLIVPLNQQSKSIQNGESGPRPQPIYAFDGTGP